MRKSTRLANGVRIITEAMPSMRSVSLGIWVHAGSRNDTVSGIAHFTEHMLFKGTGSRSAQQIAREMDALGGVLNASTAKEYTVYYTKVLDEHLEKGADILFDLFLNSQLDSGELEKEKQVVLQEISMTEDTPDDYINDLFARTFFSGSTLSTAILGEGSTVGAIGRDDILTFMDQSYDPQSLVIVATGNVVHEQLVELVGQRFSHLKSAAHVAVEEARTIPEAEIHCFEKDLEQVHITIGTRGPAITDDKRWTYIVLNTILGGSMSSLLFQEVRERLGLVYTVFSYLNAYRDCGSMVIYAGTTPENVNRTLDACARQMNRIKQGDLDGIALAEIMTQIKGNLLLSRESTESRMISNAKNELYFEREVPVEEVLAKIEAITEDDVLDLASQIFDPRQLTLVTLGRIGRDDIQTSFS